MNGRNIRLMAAGILGSAVVALGVWSGASYRRDMESARQRIEGLGSQVIETACGPIEYVETGAGYPVLAIHGNGGGFDQGLGLGEMYVGEGFRIIAPSRFGYLRTPLPQGASPATQADAHACLLDALGVEQAAVFASSAGVTSAVQFALRHPERVSALVFHSPNAPGKVDMASPPRPALEAVFHSNFTWWFMSRYLQSLTQTLLGVPENFALTPALDAEVKGVLASVSPIAIRGDGMVFDTFTGNPEINSGYPFSEITAPTLVVSAVDDPMALHANARTLAEAIPGARLMAVADGGHLLLGHTAELRAEITGFLHGATALAGAR